MSVPSATQWEYRVEYLTISERWSAKMQEAEYQTFSDRLNALGRQGWELVEYQAVPVTGSFSNSIRSYAYMAIFKKPLGVPPEDPPPPGSDSTSEPRQTDWYPDPAGRFDRRLYEVGKGWSSHVTIDAEKRELVDPEGTSGIEPRSFSDQE